MKTVYEYDKEGKLVSKTVTETHEEDTNITTNTPPPWWTYPSQNWSPYITCTNSKTNDDITKYEITMTASDRTT